MDETGAGSESEAESSTTKSKNTKSITNSKSPAEKEPKSEEEEGKKEQSDSDTGKGENEILKPVVEKWPTNSVTEKELSKSRKSNTRQERTMLKLNDVEDSTATDDPKHVFKNLNKISGNDEHFEPETVKSKECYFLKKFGNRKFGVNCNFLHPQCQRGF